MIKSAAPILPCIIASFLLLPGAKSAKAAPEWEEAGQASWYGGRHHGRPTSSGEIFNQDAMTAAHPRLPLGSKVRVTLDGSRESVVVTINDRMPPTTSRVIDLSRGAAARLGIVDRGLGRVRLTAAGAPLN